MKNDLDILLGDEFRRAVEDNLDRDPVSVALDRSVPHAAMVASQVKYLARARTKLPSWYAARCIVPARAFEQASSEATAARKEYSGELAVDLTCGLGVDSLGLSRRFGRVVAVERDPFLAAVARENFRRLGADNIEVVEGPAEEFLSTWDNARGGDRGGDRGGGPYRGQTVDLVYADPDRRDAGGKKMVRLEDSSPDIVALLPALRRVTRRLVVKLSPLFDVDEVFRVFGPGALAEVVSLGGECKEIIADVRFDPPADPANSSEPAANQPADPANTADPARPAVRAVAIGLGQVEHPVILPSSSADGSQSPAPTGASAQPFDPETCKYLILPDVALQKARLARRHLTDLGVWIESDNGYGFATLPPEGVIGRAVEIESIEPFDPKTLKRRLKSLGIKKIDILRRDFPHSTAEIARALGIKEGGPRRIAFTRAANRLWQITLKP
jgi:hypothetical protein